VPVAVTAYVTGSLTVEVPAAFTVSVNGLSANPNALVARKVIDPLEVAVGVPANTPPTNVIPAGNVLPGVKDQVIGAVPVAVKVVVG
jgi:hypothetical protein